MADQPKITLITPSYNQGDFLARTLTSVLDQNYPNLEIVISDDCPTDDIDLITKELTGDDDRVRYSRNKPSLGDIGNYRQVFKLAKGEYIKFLNDDDLLSPGCITQMARCLDRYPEVTLVTSYRRVIDENGVVGRDLRAMRADPGLASRAGL